MWRRLQFKTTGKHVSRMSPEHASMDYILMVSRSPFETAPLAGLDRSACGLAPFMSTQWAWPRQTSYRQTDRQTNKQTNSRPYTNNNWWTMQVSLNKLIQFNSQSSIETCFSYFFKIKKIISPRVSIWKQNDLLESSMRLKVSLVSLLWCQHD